MFHSHRRLHIPLAGLLATSMILAGGRVAGATATFSTGELATNLEGVGPLTSGCGFNFAGEPAIHVSRSNDVLISSERSLPLGTDVWIGSTLTRPQQGPVGGAGASACSLYYDGTPDAEIVGASGGDTDLAWAPSPLPGTGTYPAYVASLSLASVSVSHSLDNGTTWETTPIQAAVPGDDREWIAAYGPNTSLLTFHDLATREIDVLRSDDTGVTYNEISQAIPVTGTYGYAADDNELGNIAIDHDNAPLGLVPPPVGFRAYQAFVAPSAAPTIGTHNLGCADPAVFVCTNLNEAFVSVSNDGGFTWTVKPIPCSVSNSNSLDHQFPNISVAPNGNLWETWSDDTNVFVATSPDQGNTWTCAQASTGGAAIMPWIVAGQSGEDLVYYGESGGTWSVEFAQNTSTTSPATWTTTAVVAVHSGSVCEQGANCSSGRQLLDDFGVDVDQQGWAHIAYSHDCDSAPLLNNPTNFLYCSSPPSQLGGAFTYTGYAVQVSGTTIGIPN